MDAQKELALETAKLLDKFDWRQPMLDQAAHVILAALKEQERRTRIETQSAPAD